MQTNDYRPIKKIVIKKVQWNMENVVMIVIEHLEMNQISALNNP